MLCGRSGTRVGRGASPPWARQGPLQHRTRPSGPIPADLHQFVSYPMGSPRQGGAQPAMRLCIEARAWGMRSQCRVIPASLHYHTRAGQAFLQSKGGARLALFWHWSASCPTGRRHDPPVMTHRLMLDSDPKIRLAQNHCPLHSPFRSETSPRTQRVEFHQTPYIKR